MKTIFKYPIIANTRIELPAFAKFLHFGVQPGVGTAVWYQVETTRQLEYKYFRIFGTGHKIPDDKNLHWRGTCFDGPYVWHLYEEFETVEGN